MGRERDLAWRVGRKLGRTLYAMHGTEPSDDDVLIGCLDSAEIAAEAVRSHNERLSRVLGAIREAHA